MSDGSRRTLAAALACIAVVGAACGSASPEHRASAAGIRIVHFTLDSADVGRKLDEIGVVPPARSGAGKPPIVVFLHGRHGTPESGLNAAISMIQDAGAAAPAFVLANGSDDSYWHDRQSGRWGTSVVKELIPKAAAVLGADPTRVVIAGVSMGGFGALDIAKAWPGRFCGVAGHSAAIWPTGAQSNAVAFDDAEDFAKNDVMGYARTARHPYGSTPVWLDVGSGDGFRFSERTMADSLRNAGARVTFHQWPGGHNDRYWRAHLADYVAFYVRSLRSCL
jgi:enterochelin esterase-like enzyme